VTRENLWKWYDEVSAGGFLFDTSIQGVGRRVPKAVDQETPRVFDVDRIACLPDSQYRLKSMLHKKAGAPAEVLGFVEQMTKLYAPEPCFVMDVADYRGKLHVVELNCFHSLARGSMPGRSSCTTSYVLRHRPLPCYHGAGEFDWLLYRTL
jgi:hypothetical protein